MNGLNMHPIATRIIPLVLLLSALLFPETVLAQKAELKKIGITREPLTLKLHINKKVPFKVIRVEPTEVLIALKGARISKNFSIDGAYKGLVKDIGVETLQRGVIAVLLKGVRPFDRIESTYDPATPAFKVSLAQKTKKVLPQKQTPAGDRKKQVKSSVDRTKTAGTVEKKPVAPEQVKPKVTQPALPKPKAEALQKPAVKTPEKREVKPSRKQPPKAPAAKVQDYYAGIVRPQSPYNGDISDMVLKIQSSPCDAPIITQALGLLKKELYMEAFARLDAAVQDPLTSCLEQVMFLRAYAFFKSVGQKDHLKLLQAERFYQDALIQYPQSEWVPYGFGAMGLIHKTLKNNAVAEGFLNIIKESYPEYTGMPEVYYILADIYDEKGFTDKALGYFEQVFTRFARSRYTIDAGVGYGKMLYAKKRFVDSLSVIDHIINTRPKKIYESPELLLIAGNANYQLGRSKPAREHLIKVSNLFPDIEEKDVILSKVGDTYGMEDNIEKAKEVYQYVIDNFPDSSGYISSSIGLARYLLKNEKKIEIYEMIKTRFPEDKYARVAMMRLAEIYQKNGEYLRCIKEIEDLLSTHPRGLRYEAVKLMQRAYEALFKLQNDADEYTKVLNLYEEKHETIDRMGSKEIPLRVGLAYLRGGLYEQAFNHLLEAYKLYDRKSRSGLLLYNLGVAMDETGRDEDALKLFAGFVKRYPKSRDQVDAMVRMARIYQGSKKLKNARNWFSRAYKKSRKRLEKGMILVGHSRVFANDDQYSQAADYLVNAVKDIASAPGENYNVLTDTYRELGNTYLKLQKYVKAADAFSKALTFSDTQRVKANLGFLIGDAYQKGNALEKAKDAFKTVADSDDSVWARLARQRLATIELAGTVQNS